jgi:hypothetical protein
MAAAGGVELRWPAAAVAARSGPVERLQHQRWRGCSDPEVQLQRPGGSGGVQEEAAARPGGGGGSVGGGGGVREEAAARVSGSEKKLGSDYHVRGMEWIVVQWMNVLLHMGYII